jgi:pimeloyl-ACP methyl ester carboxylesterase
MRKLLVLIALLVMPILLVIAFTHSATASVSPPADEPMLTEDEVPSQDCEDGEQASGAKYRICLPTGEWNDLVVYAHGYVAPDKPVEIPEDQLILRWDDQSVRVDEVVTLMGYAFATTSYYTNGLAVQPAISDLLDLVNTFITVTERIPDHVYLAGVSEGGLITTLSVEQHPDIYDGGLAMCGPYGDLHGQVNHFADFRAVFDYFFPGLMPGSPITIPDEFLDTWEAGFFTDTVRPEVIDPANITRVDQLLNVTGVSPYGYDLPTSTASIENLLWYNVFATNDARAKLGGQPFDNQDREYSGSSDDVTLNQGVERFSADQVALDEIEAHYQTSGELSVPLVTLHTTGDPVVPYWHATRYKGKTIAADNIALHEHFRVERHGHCSFTLVEVLDAFNRMVYLAENPPQYQPVNRVFLPLTVRGG